LLDLALQPRAQVRGLFEAHPDRVLYGSDLLFERAFSTMSDDERRAALAHVKRVLEEDRAYYGTAGSLDVRGRELQGLGLPQATLQQLFEGNARRCYALG
jgi:predicted TIM-barrel fold metal-dependent hydrolase